MFELGDGEGSLSALANLDETSSLKVGVAKGGHITVFLGPGISVAVIEAGRREPPPAVLPQLVV